MKRNRPHSRLDPFANPAPPERECEQEGCTEKGEFRAPKSPTQLRDFRWFCLTHIRDYNKSWDFYRGMNPEEIEASRVSDVTWNRPSWPLGSWRTLLEKTQWCDGLGDFVNSQRPQAILPVEVQKALSTLELKFPLTQEDLKRHYKKLAKSHHPDLHAGDKDAEERLKQVNIAYQILKKYLQDSSFTKPIAH
jgi:hypothetical protein